MDSQINPDNENNPLKTEAKNQEFDEKEPENDINPPSVIDSRLLQTGDYQLHVKKTI